MDTCSPRVPGVCERLTVLSYFCACASLGKGDRALEIHFPSVGGCLDNLVNGNLRETPVAEEEGGYAVG